MTAGSRLNRLMAALTARERALLVLRAWKEDRQPGPGVTWMIPDAQADEYNRLVCLMHGANDLGVVLMGLEGVLTQAELKHAWYVTLLLVAEDMQEIAFWQLCETAEPITESAFQARLAEGRGDLLSLNEAAELLVAEEDGPGDAACARHVKAKRDEVVAAVRTGALPARGTGDRLRITAGDLSDWSGLAFAAVPEYGTRFDVRPDAEAEEVAAMRARAGSAWSGRCAAGWAWAPRLRPTTPVELDHARVGQSVTLGLACSIRTMVRELGAHFAAVETVAHEAAVEFGGEDPLPPEARAMLDDCTARLRALTEGLAPYVTGIAPGAPDEELLARVRHLARRQR